MPTFTAAFPGDQESGEREQGRPRNPRPRVPLLGSSLNNLWKKSWPSPWGEGFPGGGSEPRQLLGGGFQRWMSSITMSFVVWKFYLFVCLCMCVYVWGHVHDTAYVRSSEDNFQELVLSLHHMGLKNQTQALAPSTLPVKSNPGP